MSESGLPSGWRRLHLGDVVREYLSGGTPSTRESAYWDGDIAWTTSAVIADEAVTLSAGQRLITDSGLKQSATHLVPRGNLLVGTRVGVGKAVVNLIDIAISQDLTGLVIDPSTVDALYLAYAFKTAQTRVFFEGRKRGTTIKGVSRSDVHALPLVLPPLPGQRAIAHILRAVQTAREARQREVVLERERKAALMAHLFAHGTRGEPTKQTPIGEMPESWEVGKVGELAAIKGGKRLPKGVDFANDETRFPYIRVVDLANGSVKTDALKYLTTETQREIAQYIIRQADVYISIAGTIGLVGTIPPELDGANLTENAARLVIRKREHLSRDFLAAYLKSEGGQAQISSLTAKTTQPKLALARIAQIQVPLPLFAEQQQIAQILNSCDAKIAAVERESALLDELFRALLEELMTGRLAVTETSGHDAS